MDKMDTKETNTLPNYNEAQEKAVAALEKIADEIMYCKNCKLFKSRFQAVEGAGHPAPEVVIIGEAPGKQEDLQGFPFVGQSGKLLDLLLEQIGLSRQENVWIGNICKCRPPNNRTPLPGERKACLPFLKRQLAILQPKVIICLGTTSVKGLLKIDEPIASIRGTWYKFENIDVIATYHPAYILRQRSRLSEMQEDFKSVKEKIQV